MSCQDDENNTKKDSSATEREKRKERQKTQKQHCGSFNSTLLQQKIISSICQNINPLNSHNFLMYCLKAAWLLIIV